MEISCLKIKNCKLALSPTVCGFLLTAAVVFSTARATSADQPLDTPYLTVLGIAQDAGYPQAGCRKTCCERAWNDPSLRRGAISIAIVDPASGQRWLMDCSPDFREQFHELNRICPSKKGDGLSGILLTHAHIGHYTGLMHLGREVMGTRAVPVFAMPRMRRFLETNGPWSQLVSLKNIELKNMADGQAVELNERIRVVPFVVPHRDEYSETVGFRILGPNHSALYLPDIDKWERWNTRIEEVLATVDIAFLDGTFYSDREIPGRNMSEIPHPFILESIKRLAALPESERAKVRFLHFNHTNPVLDADSNEARSVTAAGHKIAQQGEIIGL
jgi:pyrroloquinoline quinone biosynthesis protein B